MGTLLFEILTSETLGTRSPLFVALISRIALESAVAPVELIATWEKTDSHNNDNSNATENKGGIFMILREGGFGVIILKNWRESINNYYINNITYKKFL